MVKSVRESLVKKLVNQGAWSFGWWRNAGAASQDYSPRCMPTDFLVNDQESHKFRGVMLLRLINRKSRLYSSSQKLQKELVLQLAPGVNSRSTAFIWCLSSLKNHSKHFTVLVTFTHSHTLSCCAFPYHAHTFTQFWISTDTTSAFVGALCECMSLH